jgi:hypothetical protein
VKEKYRNYFSIEECNSLAQNNVRSVVLYITGLIGLFKAVILKPETLSLS